MKGLTKREKKKVKQRYQQYRWVDDPPSDLVPWIRKAFLVGVGESYDERFLTLVDFNTSNQDQPSVVSGRA